MFSWIIEHKARIISINSGTFIVENTFDEVPQEGQSIAHDGACMTITSASEDQYSFFVMEESLSVTNFGEKKVGDFFNVERCMKLSDRLDGHIVSGHIDAIGKVIKREKRGDGSLFLTVFFDAKYKNYIVRKGSIAVNGVSLTIVEVGNNFFSISLIPLTQDWTNLWALKIDDSVNLEFDMLAKYVERMMQK